MNKSERTSATLLQRIDELLIPHHPFLKIEDEVYFIGEYTNGKRAEFSPMNRLIFNYKKETKWKGSPHWGYKASAIKEVADSFRKSILQTSGFPDRIKHALLVPVPPSKAKDHPEHDDRNVQMLQNLAPTGNIHELIVQKTSRQPLHESNRRDPQKLEEYYFLNETDLCKEFTEIWLFDDILRHGTHFRAIHNLLRRRFPKVKIVGFFVARSVQHSPLL